MWVGDVDLSSQKLTNVTVSDVCEPREAEILSRQIKRFVSHKAQIQRMF
jgi:hypothetical protein